MTQSGCSTVGAGHRGAATICVLVTKATAAVEGHQQTQAAAMVQTK